MYNNVRITLGKTREVRAGERENESKESRERKREVRGAREERGERVSCYIVCGDV